MSDVRPAVQRQDAIRSISPQHFAEICPKQLGADSSVQSASVKA